MMRACVVLLSAFAAIGSMSAQAQQFGVCTRAANDAASLVSTRTQEKVQFVLRHNYPPHVIQAHLDIIYFSQQEAFNSISTNHAACVAGYRHPQQIVDTAVVVFTMGLNRALPPGMTRIDISEVIDGRPFGGPTAIVPEVRERILGGDRGTGANIIRDPIRCLTFQREC